MIILIVGQLGIYNRCTCWTQWGNAALVLPQLESIAATVNSRLRVWWVLIALGLGLQAGFCGGCAWMFWDAVRVYLMKDEGGVAEVRVEAGVEAERKFDKILAEMPGLAKECCLGSQPLKSAIVERESTILVSSKHKTSVH